MIANETNILPYSLAAVAAGRILPDDRQMGALVEHLVYKAEVAYAHSPDMKAKLHQPGTRGQAFLAAMMRGWAEEWAKTNLQEAAK